VFRRDFAAVGVPILSAVVLLPFLEMPRWGAAIPEGDASAIAQAPQASEFALQQIRSLALPDGLTPHLLAIADDTSVVALDRTGRFAWIGRGGRPIEGVLPVGGAAGMRLLADDGLIEVVDPSDNRVKQFALGEASTPTAGRDLPYEGVVRSAVYSDRHDGWFVGGWGGEDLNAAELTWIPWRGGAFGEPIPLPWPHAVPCTSGDCYLTASAGGVILSPLDPMSPAVELALDGRILREFPSALQGEATREGRWVGTRTVGLWSGAIRVFSDLTSWTRSVAWYAVDGSLRREGSLEAPFALVCSDRGGEILAGLLMVASPRVVLTRVVAGP